MQMGLKRCSGLHFWGGLGVSRIGVAQDLVRVCWVKLP